MPDARRTLRAIARGGPCGDCGHARLVSTPRGSDFLRCLHASTPKYPPQPLRACPFRTPVVEDPAR